jgi:hypothetical protein
MIRPTCGIAAEQQESFFLLAGITGGLSSADALDVFGDYKNNPYDFPVLGKLFSGWNASRQLLKASVKK